MLVASLVGSLLLLVVANSAARRGTGSPGLAGAACVAGGVLIGAFLGSLVVLFQAVLMGFAVIVFIVPRRGKALYLPASLASTAAAWGVVIWTAVEQQHEFARLRDQSPFESMEARLPVPPSRNEGAVADRSHLDQLEAAVEAESRTNRTWSLQRLHGDRVQLFINSAGFGSGRMVRQPTEESLKGYREDAPVPQEPEPRESAAPTGGTPERRGVPDVAGLHNAAVVDFANPRGFGLVRDGRQVAGFQPHGMSRRPGPVGGWDVRTIDLIGLILHEQPVAYVTAHLPRMDELRSAPTRPLEAFEAEGLAALRRGEDIVTRADGGSTRLIGAVRSVKQCVECHGGERGALLGAFSYTLAAKR